MSPETLNCPMCGAAISSDDPQCQYCRSRLATITCTQCFASIFAGSKYCPRCGAAATKPEILPAPVRKCPRCQIDLREINVSTATLRECERCLGLWLDVASFETLCANREQQASVLGTASPAPHNAASDQARIKYVPCPECGQLMNRINFARCSGVIVDVCKGHGTWFDHDELSRIVEFIRSGGLEASRTRERLAIEEERKRLRQEQAALDRDRSSIVKRALGEERIGGIASARGLLKFLLE